MNFKFQVDVTEQDYINFNKFHITKTDYGKKTKKTLKKTVILLFAVFIIIALIFGGFKGALLSSLLFIPIGLVFFFLTEKILLSSVTSTAKDLKKTGKLPYIPSSVVEFNEEGYIDVSEIERIERKYSAIENVSISEEYKAIYVFTSSASAVILPYSAFESREQIIEFIDFIKLKDIKVTYY